jgi:rod shape-determining protein MreD
MRANVSYTSREQIEVYKFSPLVSVGVPLLALFLQSFLPVRFHVLSIFDLPLLVTIFFGMARRNQLAGLATGAIIGLVQDALTHGPIGIYGIAKTVIGYAASSLGVKIDVENPGSRLLMTMVFYFIHGWIIWGLARGLTANPIAWRGAHELIAAVSNGLLAVVLFAILDHFKRRG